MELYQQIFRGLREVQKQKLNAQREEAQEIPSGRAGQKNFTSPLIPASLTLFQNGKNLRATILAMLRSAFFTLHELASVHNKIVQVGQSQGCGLPAAGNSLQLPQGKQDSESSKALANLSKNLR
jgi:hypothetical protein